MRTLTSELLDALEAGFSGELISPENAAYDGARAVWNGMIDSRPALIARCASREDVAACVNAARTLGCVPAVRCGGHQVAGYSVCDGGLVIDLGGLTNVTVAPEARVAVAGGGCLLGDVDRATQQYGLVCPAGVVSHTGLGGLALSGGIGWTSRKFGLTCDNIRAVEIVTADGTIRRAASDENPELYWAVRGGGGNFGIVTAFELKLHPLREVHLSVLAFPFDQLIAVLSRQADLALIAPEDLSMATILRQAAGPFALPGFSPGQTMVLAMFVHCGDPADAERVVQAARGWGDAIVLRSGITPYCELQTMGDELAAHGVRAYEKSAYIRQLDAAAVAAIVSGVAWIPSPNTQVEVLFVGGAAARVAEEATAFPGRDAAICFNIVAMWRDARDDAANVAWARDYYASMEAHLSGGYANFVGDEQERVAGVFGPAKLGRLRQIKRQYDPDNLFRRNLNIVPASSRARHQPGSSERMTTAAR
jgi:FAD/FMN-containing dehydrogenase